MARKTEAFCVIKLDGEDIAYGSGSDDSAAYIAAVASINAEFHKRMADQWIVKFSRVRVPA